MCMYYVILCFQFILPYPEACSIDMSLMGMLSMEPFKRQTFAFHIRFLGLPFPRFPDKRKGIIQ